MATTSVVSSTSFMPPWNSAGSRVSNGPVSCADSCRRKWPAVPSTSRAAVSGCVTTCTDGLLRNHRIPRSVGMPRYVDPLEACARVHRSARRNLQRIRTALNIAYQPQAQRVVVVDYSLQRPAQILLAHRSRHLQQYRLVEG